MYIYIYVIIYIYIHGYIHVDRLHVRLALETHCYFKREAAEKVLPEGGRITAHPGDPPYLEDINRKHVKHPLKL